MSQATEVTVHVDENRQLAVDGTGQIVRPGDRVMRIGWEGTGKIVGLHREYFADVDLPNRGIQVLALSEIRRADDMERDWRGRPLWIEWSE